MADDKGADVNRVYEGNYNIHAYDISLLSEASKGADAPGGSWVFVAAEGGGMDKMDGHVLVTATGSALMVVGTASVGISKTASGQEVHVECDATGTITIHQGDMVASPTILLKPDGITMTVGLPGLGSQIQMTQDKITLQVGPLAKMEMTAQGIKLVVADMNSVELKPTEVDVQGLSVKVNGQLQTEIQGGVQTKVSAGAMLQAQGAITMIG
jgi:hypothetical protein